ncbi:hypothetical protein DNTS_020801 [Danionella cerebrum]|uniref:DNA damage-inducible transcript 3 protein n=1 Tax=Danionella cerebrum TaxID=2873325 RepID=A0A553RE65_9TELE|nr:hypothetical protein DNTS_020801 [Danionella translucida]
MMAAEWMYPPGVGPLCGAELEAWYEDLQDILGSDAAKLTRAPPTAQKEPEFLDVLESCSLTWLTEGQVWSDGVQRVSDERLLSHPQNPPRAEERRGAEPDHASSSTGDLLPPEFFELLSDGGVGSVEMMVSEETSYKHRREEDEEEEEELPRVPETSSSSSESYSPSQNCSSPSSPLVSSSSSSSSSRKRKQRNAETGVCSSSGKKSRREREQENERKVQELTDQNERLKAEIERLGEEVQRTRRALIERLVNTRR